MLSVFDVKGTNAIKLTFKHTPSLNHELDETLTNATLVKTFLIDVISVESIIKTESGHIIYGVTTQQILLACFV
jgi:hypothetical protein